MWHPGTHRAGFRREQVLLAAHDGRGEVEGHGLLSDVGQGKCGGKLGKFSATQKLLCHFLESASLPFNIF